MYDTKIFIRFQWFVALNSDEQILSALNNNLFDTRRQFYGNFYHT